MDFDQLHTFLEIVRLKSFSKAALTCYRTQPAISAQVRQLEQELNTSLFERFGSRISLTTAGKIFAGYAAQMLDQRRQAQDAINELDRNPRGELVIAANEGIKPQTVEHAEIAAQWRKVLLLGVADADGQKIRAAARQVFGEFKTKRAKRTAMLAE